MSELLSASGSAATLVAYTIYLQDIRRGETIPNMVTWIIWAIIPFTALVASVLGGGERGGVWLAATFTVGSVLVIIFGIRYQASWKFGKTEKIAGGLAAMAVLGGMIFNSSLVALLLAIAADGSGFWPTFSATHQDPSTESKVAWLWFCVGGILSFAGGLGGNIFAWGFPAYVSICQLYMVWLTRNN